MFDRNIKSERILTKLRVLDYEYISDRIARFHKKILRTHTWQSITPVPIVDTYAFEWPY